jgi:sigma-B regulation protein RsbU (phosphoserine phosphatase)
VPVTASEILQTLRREEIPLLLSHAFITIGLVAAAFCLVSRKLNALLAWFSLFAFLYGFRMWLEFDTTGMLMPGSRLLYELRMATAYLVPIPAFYYFEAAGFLSKYGKKIAHTFTAVYLALFLGALIYGRLHLFDHVNSIIVILSLGSLTIVSLTRKAPDRDYILLRRGLLVFITIVLIDNIASFFNRYPYVEPYGFAIFLAILGYVAGRRTLQRDLQLAEIQKELDMARRIQMANLPAPYRNSPAFRVATRYVPMTSVAGDFYDFLIADDHQTGLLIADVSGHGVPAALIASMVKLAASAQRANAAHPAALLSGMNDALCGNTQGQFVTAAYVYLNAESGRLRYSAAAHPPMLLLRNGAVTEILENGLLLAAFPFATFTTVEHSLLPGDRLVLYTDGVLEAANANHEEFGQTRLQQLLLDNSNLPAQQLADRIIHAVQQWSRTQDDDLTLLICDYVPPA